MFNLFTLLFCVASVHSFRLPRHYGAVQRKIVSRIKQYQNQASNTALSLSQSPVSITDGERVQPESGEVIYPEDISSEWEVDCYSRPVLMDDGKKLWEVLITDSTGNFRYLKTLPNNLVNSRNLRKVIEEVMEESPVRPTTIRFFRSQMFNMISIALQVCE